MHERNNLGQEVQITVEKRIGKSTVKNVRDGCKAVLMIILRILSLGSLMFEVDFGNWLAFGAITAPNWVFA
jgi:hypothetical protein